MDDRPVVFLDSGLGSLPYGSFFHSHNAAEKLICLADRANFPYGSKSSENLISLLDELTSKLVSFYNPKILVLACNTASVTALAFLREKYTAFPIVGTVPAVKPAVTASRTRRVGILGTERTIDDPYIRVLAERFGPDCDIMAEAAPELVQFVEGRYASSTSAQRSAVVSPYVEKFRTSGVDSVVLGCTHFLLLLDEFRMAAGNDMAVFDSVEGVCRRVEAILDEEEGVLRAGRAANGKEPLLVVTGGYSLESYWEQFSTRFGFSLRQATECGFQ